MIFHDPEQFMAFMLGETDDPGEVTVRRGGIQFPRPRGAEAFDQGAEMTHQHWNKIQAAADGSRVLLTLLATGDEQYAQAQLDRMSDDQLLDLEACAGQLTALAGDTRLGRRNEQIKGSAL